MSALMEQLREILPPPPEVPKLTPADWIKAEETIGTPLPSDFKEFVDEYGSGDIGMLLLIPSPLSSDEDTRLVPFVDKTLGLLREIRAAEMPMPFPIYPEPGGLLPFGEPTEGDVFGWLGIDG